MFEPSGLVEAYQGFSSIKQLGIFPLDGMLVHYIEGYPQQSIPGIHLYTLVERGTARVKCLMQEHNMMTQSRA